MRVLRWGAALLPLLLVLGCDPVVADPPGPAPTGAATGATTTPAPGPTTAGPTAPTRPTPPEAPVAVTFTAVVDGDTVTTSAGTVRLIGIDTPERGQCGHDEAAAVISALVSPGDPVTLELPEGENDADAHGRLLRYVATRDGVDLGLAQLEAGNAVARYDSTDGYPAHPREAAYRAAQRATLGRDGSVVTSTCAEPATPAPPATAPDPGEPWWTKYSSCKKLKKNTVGDPTGPFRRDDPAEADIYDWFANGTGNRGDGDHDGLACE